MKQADITTINGRFKRMRTDANMTQKEMAYELGITRVSVNAIEINRFLPSIELIRKAHKRFKKSYNWIIDGTEELSHQETEQILIQLNEAKKTIEDLRENNEMLRDYIKALKKC
jgi:DNA-binding XRE family transcriptional regulator